MKQFLLSFFAFAMMLVPTASNAGGHEVGYNLIGVQGYDLVAYHTKSKALRGNGHNVAVHDGISYQFMNADNRKAFEENPAKYLPAYGGYCAFGVAKGKKFSADPTVWKVVDGTLYLNLDKKIQGLWNEDIPGLIKDADKNWSGIQGIKASDL